MAKKSSNQPSRHQADARRSTEPPAPADAETRRLLHELQVHQIELELQNAELERAWAEAEKRLELYTDLYDFAPVGYFTLEQDGTILQTNLAGASLLGVVRSRLQRQRFAAYVTSQSLPALAALLDRVFAREGQQTLEVTLSPADDHPLRQVQLKAILDAGGHACRIAAVDITELKHAQQVKADQARQLSLQAEQLRAADRRKDEFLAMLGHELRNPLAPILAAAELLDRPKVVDEARRAWAVGAIKRQGAHLVRLVDELLDTARVTQGKLTLSKACLDLTDLMAGWLETGNTPVDRRQHVFVVSLPSEPVTVVADSVRMTQVLANLLDNAVKYTPAGGQIRLSLASEGAEAVVRVCDTGIGIAEPQLGQVFDLFAQTGPARRQAHDGLGVGLAVVKCLVELHGGTVQAKSAGIGQGSEFVVRLPLSAAVLAADDAPGDAGAPAAKPSARRILVVDDQEDIVKSMALMLETMGHRVAVARSGQEACELVAAIPLEVILLDIGMPGMSGYEVARKIRQDPGLGHLTLIAVTGYGLGPEREHAFQAGFDWHLVKPVKMGELQSILAGAVPRRRPKAGR